MKIQYAVCAIITLLFIGIFVTYIALPVMILVGVYFIFCELKRRLLFNKWQKVFSQDASEDASDAISAGKIIDVEFHEVN